MCIAALAIDAHRRFALVVAANRDEFFDRPAAALDWWTPPRWRQPILAGRDLAAGGTWMGLSLHGRLALVTNVRRPGAVAAADAPSRGLIVPDWLQGAEAADRFWARVALFGYAPFNLVAADFRHGECFWASNELASARRLERGITVISNAAALDAPWPKVQRLKAALRDMLQGTGDAEPADALMQRLLTLLQDATPAEDHLLPRTGLPLERERQLSSTFIRTPDGAYGTRCSTVVVTERVAGRQITHVLERSVAPGADRPTVRRATLADWPLSTPAPAYGEVPPAWRVIDADGPAGQSARTISTWAMPASSNTGPRC
jgi:uncharacterized protein with NRDE domain